VTYSDIASHLQQDVPDLDVFGWNVGLHGLWHPLSEYFWYGFEVAFRV
jgi:hypothetical protein